MYSEYILEVTQSTFVNYAFTHNIVKLLRVGTKSVFVKLQVQVKELYKTLSALDLIKPTLVLSHDV